MPTSSFVIASSIAVFCGLATMAPASLNHTMTSDDDSKSSDEEFSENLEEEIALLALLEAMPSTERKFKWQRRDDLAERVHSTTGRRVSRR